MEKIDISYFSLSLRSFLREYHPDLMQSVNFVTSRAEAAEETYHKSMMDKGDNVLALEEANQVLFAGLNFSKFSFLKDILEKEFFLEVQKSDIESAALGYLGDRELRDVFDKYALTDDFEDDEERYQMLYTEVTGAIYIQMEQVNGI